MNKISKEIAGIATALAAAVAWFAAPIVRYAPAAMFYFTGFAMLVGLAGLWVRTEIDSPVGFSIKLGSWMFPVGLLGFLAVLTYAAWISDMNDERCFKIQRHMLYPVPDRPDLKELFTALGCRPQGRDDVQFPIAKKAPVVRPSEKSKSGSAGNTAKTAKAN